MNDDQPREGSPYTANALLLNALAKHPQREIILELTRERDDRGVRRWSLSRLVEDDVEDPWVEVWLLPHPSDRAEDRHPIKVGTWPLRVDTDTFTNARAVIEQYGDGSR